MKAALRHLLVVLLCLGGCHLLGTGSPVPLWYYEELSAPQPVARISESAVTLTDGTSHPLPLLTGIPADDPLLRLAVAEGVEVTTDGELIGLLPIQRICGNDPVYWRKLRVNLSDLCAVLHPELMDERVIEPEAIDVLRPILNASSQRRVPDGLLIMNMDLFRRWAEPSRKAATEADRPVLVAPGGHDERTGGLAL